MMPMRRRDIRGARIQSAMEYLMTYGWAILVIAIVLGVLYYLGIFGWMASTPMAQPGSCQVLRPNGPGTNFDVGLSGTCNNELPEYVLNEGPGSSGYITVSGGAAAVLQRSQTFTVTAWVDERRPIVNCDGSGVTGTGATAAIIQMSNLEFYTGGCFNLGLFLQGSGVWSGLEFGQNDKWYFVAAEYNGTSNTLPNIMLYLDMRNQTDTVATNLVTGSPSLTLDNGFNGTVADVQLYNSTLSGNEIHALYMEGVGGAPMQLQNLVGWWPLNGNANDYSGNLNNGAATAVSYTSSWASGYAVP